MPLKRSPLRLCEESQDWPDEDIDPYIPLFDAVNFNALTNIALDLRRNSSSRLPEALTCSVDSNILGSYSIVSVLVFSDGVKWAAKIPRYGISAFFGRLNQQKMLSEILTLRLIRLKTSLPVAEMHAWDMSREKIGVPFILMDFLEGTSVDRLWFDPDWSTEERRSAVLRNLAKAMSSLHALQFDAIGALHFNEQGDFVKIGELVVQSEGDIFHPEYEVINGHQAPKWPEAATMGPFPDAKAFLLTGVKELEDEKGLSGLAAKQRKADVTILRIAIDSIPIRQPADNSFVLGHPNLDATNILVNKAGEITGLLDWDGVHTNPRGYGYSCYPSWITRDWDPIMYGYSDPELEEDSPDKLSGYRQQYSAAFGGLGLPASDYSLDDTRLSHIYEALTIASGSFWNLSPIDKLLQHAFCGPRQVRAEHFDVEVFRGALADELEAGRGKDMVERIREAFWAMWHPEWEFTIGIAC